MILGPKHNSLAGGHFDLPPCTKSDPYTPCNKGLSDVFHKNACVIRKKAFKKKNAFHI